MVSDSLADSSNHLFPPSGFGRLPLPSSSSRPSFPPCYLQSGPVATFRAAASIPAWFRFPQTHSPAPQPHLSCQAPLLTAVLSLPCRFQTRPASSPSPSKGPRFTGTPPLPLVLLSWVSSSLSPPILPAPDFPHFTSPHQASPISTKPYLACRTPAPPCRAPPGAGGGRRRDRERLGEAELGPAAETAPPPGPPPDPPPAPNPPFHSPRTEGSGRLARVGDTGTTESSGGHGERSWGAGNPAPAPALGRPFLAASRPVPGRAVLRSVAKVPAERGQAQRAAVPPSGSPRLAPARVPCATGAPRLRTPRPAGASLRLRNPECSEAARPAGGGRFLGQGALRPERDLPCLCPAGGVRHWLYARFPPAPPGQRQQVPTSKGIPGRSAGSSPFSPPSTASHNEERLSLGPAGVGLRELGRGPRSRSSGGGGGSGKCCCTSGGGGRPGSAPAGPEPQEGERAEEGEEEGKKEEEERSSQQARGGRTSWCGGCQQPRKGDSETEPKGAERRRDPLVPRGRRLERPTRPDHRSGSTCRIRGLSRPSRISRETLGASEAAPGLHQGGGGSFFSGAQTFHGDALRGEVRPPKRTGQSLIAVCAPRAAGAKRPQGTTARHLRRPDPRPSLLAEAESLQTQLWSSAATAAGKTCPCSPFSPPSLPCSPFTSQAPPIPARPSHHVGPRRPQGP